MQIDTHVSIGNIISTGVFVFGLGGAWYSIKAGQKNSEEKIDALAKEVREIREKYLTKEMDAAKEAATTIRIDEMVRRIALLEGQLAARPLHSRKT